eukprot:586289-Rhodomonas_salina.3
MSKQVSRERAFDLHCWEPLEQPLAHPQRRRELVISALPEPVLRDLNLYCGGLVVQAPKPFAHLLHREGDSRLVRDGAQDLAIHEIDLCPPFFLSVCVFPVFALEREQERCAVSDLSCQHLIALSLPLV